MPATASTASATGLFTGEYMLQVVGSFFLVITVLMAVLLILRRSHGVGKSREGSLQVVASVSVGQRERVVLLQVGSEQILLGVASGGVSTLHHLPTPVVDEVSSGSLSFSEIWSFAKSAQGVKR